MEQRVLYNTASNYAAQIVTIGLGLLLTPFLLHSLGPSAYGLWVLVSSVAGYGALLDFGIASAIVKYTSEYQARSEHAQADSLVATAVSLYLLLGLTAVLLGVVLAPIFPHLFSVPPGSEATASWLVLLAGINVGVAIPSATTTAILRGLHRFDLANLIGIAGTVLNAVLTVGGRAGRRGADRHDGRGHLRHGSHADPEHPADPPRGARSEAALARRRPAAAAHCGGVQLVDLYHEPGGAAEDQDRRDRDRAVSAAGGRDTLCAGQPVERDGADLCAAVYQGAAADRVDVRRNRRARTAADRCMS